MSRKCFHLTQAFCVWEAAAPQSTWLHLRIHFRNPDTLPFNNTFLLSLTVFFSSLCTPYRARTHTHTNTCSHTQPHRNTLPHTLFPRLSLPRPPSVQLEHIHTRILSLILASTLKRAFVFPASASVCVFVQHLFQQSYFPAESQAPAT